MKKTLIVALIVAAGTAHPVPAAAHPGYRGPCHAAVDRYWPAPLRARMHYIVHRESRGIPTAVNRIRTRAGNATGCAQMLPGYARPFLRRAGCRNLYEATCNIRAAYQLYRVAGWSPWRVR